MNWNTRDNYLDSYLNYHWTMDSTNKNSVLSFQAILCFALWRLKIGFVNKKRNKGLFVWLCTLIRNYTFCSFTVHFKNFIFRFLFFLLIFEFSKTKDQRFLWEFFSEDFLRHAFTPFTTGDPLSGSLDMQISKANFGTFPLFWILYTMKFEFSNWFWSKIVTFEAASGIAGGLAPANNALLFAWWKLPNFQMFQHWKGYPAGVFFRGQSFFQRINFFQFSRINYRQWEDKN